MKNIAKFVARRGLFGLLVAMLLSVALADNHQDATHPTPEGFDKYLVYMGTGAFDPADPGPGPDVWHRDIMERSDEGIEEDRRAAEAFFSERFGLDFTDVDAHDGVKELDGVTLQDFMLHPNREYRVYTISGEAVPSEGWVVRDGGWRVDLNEETTLHGAWGGADGTTVPAGSFLVFGDYNIDVPDGENIIIHYESGSPISPTDQMTFHFICDLSHPEWGAGLAQGVVNMGETDDGRQQMSIRNVLTFPGRAQAR